MALALGSHMHHDSSALHSVHDLLAYQVIVHHPTQAGLSPSAVIPFACDDSQAARSSPLCSEDSRERDNPTCVTFYSIHDSLTDKAYGADTAHILKHARE